MTIPGFTAEASLYQTSGHYHMAKTLDALENSGQVLSQLRPSFFLDKLCEDTAWCLNEPSNPCQLTSKSRSDLRTWYINNCGGIPDLVA
jgi:hypothetical protein